MGGVRSAIRFGDVVVQPAAREVSLNGVPAALGARAFDVLMALIERSERVVSKHELLDLVWPDTVVEENNLQVHISALRKTLGPKVIATIPGRGYRFTAALDYPSSPPESARFLKDAAGPGSPAGLPAHLSEIIGREDDVEAVRELLRQHALVSLVGAGGIGKTRLALAVAYVQRVHVPDGVWWVELATLSEGALVAGAIAQALGVRVGDERPVLETVVTLLRTQTALLVLDNCEHLLDAAAECVRVLLRNAPALRVLVTSQEALHIPEEHVYRLGSLPIAGTPNAPGAAIQLFVARAQAADPRVQLTVANLETIAEICRRLDGMPLAIELAAARVRLLGIEGLRARLDERFHILTGGTRSVLRRHQTLRAALEWSHGLLSADERTVFRRLGVFVGGFTLELAQGLAADDQIDCWAVLDVVGHLVDKSLVVADGEELPRYRMLETVRAFALEQLAASGETSTLLRRHAEALLAIFVPVNDRRFALTFAESVRHGAELDNLRAALAWAESKAGNRSLALELIGSSRCIWFYVDLLNEGIERALRLLPLPDGMPLEVEARFNLLLGSLGYRGARRQCFVAALRAAELYRSLGNTVHQLDALVSAAQIGPRLGETKRCAYAIAEAETLIGPHTLPRQAASLALAKSIYHVSLDQLEQAFESALRQAALYGESDDAWDVRGMHLGQCNAAFYECGLGRFDSAIARLRTALEALRQMNAPHGLGQALAFLACAHALRGDRDEALANGQAAVPHLQRTQNVSWLLQYIALVHSRHGSEDRAASLVGYVDRDFARAGRILYPMQTRIRDETLTRAQAALGADEVEHRTASGGKLTEEQAIALAFASR